MHRMRKALIIGAGPAGLTAAYELLTNRQPGSPAVDNSYDEEDLNGSKKPHVF